MPLVLRMKSVFPLAAVILAVCLSASAQTETATLSGVIQDPKGAVVPDVEVTVTRIETGTISTTKTNGAGIYVLTALMPGHYHLLIRRAGFKVIAIKEFELHVQDTLEQNFSLEIGSISETVTVNANNEHMATDDPAVGLLVDRTFVENMPLNGRSFQDLIALAPGTLTSPNNPNGYFTINGQHDDANYYTVDGVAANINPTINQGDFRGLAGTLPGQTALGTTQSLASVDALQEFKVQTSSYTAEYGRQPGGQVALTTRSGTNDIHGSLFDYFRNTVLDANCWFCNANAIPRQPEHQNDFGGTLGGPLILPRIYDGRDKTFYFVSYEGLRLDQPSFTGIIDVPTAALRQFASPTIRPFLNSLPLPNVQGHLENGDQCIAALDPTNPNYAFSCTGEFSAGFSSPSSLDALSVRIDQTFGSIFQVFGRYSNTPSYVVLGGPENIKTAANTHTWTLGSAVKLSQDLLAEFRFNYSRATSKNVFTLVPFDGSVPYPLSSVVPPQYNSGIDNISGQVFVNIPNANVVNLPSWGGSFNQQTQFNIVGSLSWIHGTHSLKSGADYRRLLPVYSPGSYGVDYFLNSISAIQQGFADLAFTLANQQAHPVLNNLSLYVEDHWKVSSRLTLDYGLRWEFNPAPGATDGIYPLALTTANLATTGIAPKGTPQYHNVYHDFAPRVGFAYGLNSSHVHSVVIRGGFGIFYDTGQALGLAGYLNYPFFAFKELMNVAFPISANVVVPPSLNFPLTPPYGNINDISDPNLKLPYTEAWSLSVDQAINTKNILTLSYVGNSGRKLLFTAFYPNAGTVNPNFGEISITNNAASSSYNALQLQDQGYLFEGMQVIASYTWAHAIDNASVDNGQNAPLRGNSNSDVRQALNVALSYRIPGSRSTEFLRVITHGWSIDGRFSAQTGYPIDVFQGLYILPNGGEAYFRPNLVPGVPIYLHNEPNVLGGWELNPAAFSPVPTDPNTGAPLQQGTLGRNYVHGPAFWNLNMAVQRTFPIHERLKLDFRVDAFNILNHPNAGSVDACLCNSTFGQSGGMVSTIGNVNPLYSTGAARSLQLMLRLIF
jgi:hypothetical protein